MALRGNNTMAEELQKMLQGVGALKILPDADPEFIASLEDMIVSKLREPHDAAAAAGISMAGGQPQMNRPPGPPGQPGMQMMQGGGGMQLPPGFTGGGGGMPQGAGAPNMPMGSIDEFKRMVG